MIESSKNRYAFLLGISDYENFESYEFPDKVIKTFQDLLIDTGYYDSTSIISLRTDCDKTFQPNINKIRAKFKYFVKEILEPKKDERCQIIIYFLCHGGSFKKENYIFPKDVEPYHIEGTSIKVQWFIDQIKAIGDHWDILFIIDACRVDMEEDLALAKAKGFTKEVDHSYPAGINILWACAPGDTSKVAREKHTNEAFGIFSRALLNGLMNDLKGPVPNEKLETYLTSEVRRIAIDHGKPPQKPWLSLDSNDLGSKKVFFTCEGEDTEREITDREFFSADEIRSEMYICYSYSDKELVDSFLEVYRSLGLKINTAETSIMKDKWKERVKLLIKKSDIFILFWSTSAMQSTFVAAEYKYALKLVEQKGEHFFRPCYWETPMPPLPVELKMFHFHKLRLETLPNLKLKEQAVRQSNKIEYAAGTQIFQSELDALRELEDDLKKSLILVKELDYQSTMGYTIKNNKIEGINLRDCGISTLPESIGNFKSLELLRLDNNKLITLPESIGNLTKLQTLWLGHNKITSLPKSINTLKSLHKIWLNNNDMLTLPESMCYVKSLQELYLYKNKLTTLPESIGNLSSLQNLELSENQLTTLPKSIGNLTSLISLLVDFNNLLELPESIWNLTLLRSLKLHCNKLSSLPESILNLSNLKNLWIWKNPLKKVRTLKKQLRRNGVKINGKERSFSLRHWSLSNKLSYFSGFVGVLVAAISIIISAFLTPNFNPLYYTVSSLSLGPGKSIFNIGLVTAGALGIPFYYNLGNSLIVGNLRYRRLATGLSIFTSLCTVYLGMSSDPTYPTAFLIFRGTVTLITFTGSSLYIVLYSFLMAPDYKYPKFISFMGYLVGVLFIVFIITLVTFFEWVLIITILIWILSVASIKLTRIWQF